MSFKNKIYLFLFIGSFAVITSVAQSQAIDSLTSLIKKAPDDTTKVNHLNALTSEYFTIGNYDSVLINSTRALKLSKEIRFTKGEAIALFDLGWCYQIRNDYPLALRYARGAMGLFHSIDNKRGVGSVHLLFANINIVQGKYDSARYNIDAALEAYQKVNYKPGRASALSTLGYLYDYKSDSKNAVASYLEAIKIYEELGDKNGALYIYQSLADYYRIRKDFEKAKFYLFNQLSFYKKIKNNSSIASTFIGLGNIHLDDKKYDSALYYFLQAKTIYEKGNERYSLAIALNNIGDVYRFTNEFGQAVKYYGNSLAICYEINDVEGTVYPLDGMAVIFTKIGNYKLAEEYLEKSRKTAESLNVLALLSDNYLHSSHLDSARNNFKMAYEWYKKYIQVRDSIQSKQNSKNLLEMQSRFESEKKDQEIKFLNDEKNLKEVQQQKERNLYLTLLAASILFIGALLYIVIQKIKTGKVLKNQKQEISQKNEDLNQINEELKTVLETIESQNQTLADKNQKLEDLHEEKDGLIGIVAHDLRSPLTKTTGLIDLISMSGPLTDDQREYIQMIKKVCSEGNSLIKDLLEIRSIEDAQPEETSMSVVDISSYLDVCVSHHLPLGKEKNINIVLEKVFDDSVNMMTNAEYLTRILDNLVSNALKFSPRDTTVYIKAKTKGNQVFISISDQGPGLTELDRANLFKKFKRLTAKPTGGESSTGLGLSIVKTLVDRLNGKIIVESTVGKGSTFTVVFPSFNLSYASQQS